MIIRHGQWCAIDLTPTVNNLARIHEDRAKSICEAYFSAVPTGGFPEEELPPAGAWFEADDAAFYLMPPTPQGDNVETFGQNLQVPALMVEQCWVLGATEGASSFEGNLHLVTATGSHRVPFGLTSWTGAEADFDDRRAVRCEFLRMLNGDIRSFKASLWSVGRHVGLDEPVIGVEFPDVPGLHIFAITFLVREGGQ